MPKLWTTTIETHRHDVREAILEATMALVGEHGPLAVTMSQIAGRTGIGRATLYKYFDDVEAILVAWHDRQVAHHLEHLRTLRDHGGDPRTRLHAVLDAFAQIRHEHHDPDLAPLLHRGAQIGEAHQQLTGLVSELVTEAAAAGLVRDDVPPAELAIYCLHAVAAAMSLPSRAAVSRLVEVTLAGLCPDRKVEKEVRNKRSRKR
jgi:AcrR family transcriptional regulator